MKNRVTVQELRERFIEFKCSETDSHRTCADIRTRLNGFCYQSVNVRARDNHARTADLFAIVA